MVSVVLIGNQCSVCQIGEGLERGQDDRGFAGTACDPLHLLCL